MFQIGRSPYLKSARRVGCWGKAPTENFRGNPLNILSLCFTPPLYIRLLRNRKSSFAQDFCPCSPWLLDKRKTAAPFNGCSGLPSVCLWLAVFFLFLLDAGIDTADFLFVRGDNQICVGGAVAPLHIMRHAYRTHFLNRYFHLIAPLSY